jgi:hypothetical protein
MICGGGSAYLLFRKKTARDSSSLNFAISVAQPNEIAPTCRRSEVTENSSSMKPLRMTLHVRFCIIMHHPVVHVDLTSSNVPLGSDNIPRSARESERAQIFRCPEDHIFGDIIEYRDYDIHALDAMNLPRLLRFDRIANREEQRAKDAKDNDHKDRHKTLADF